MADDDLDLSQFQEFSDTAARASGGGGGSGAKGRGSSRRKRRWWLWLLVGIVLGVAGTLFLPDLVAPYLPTVLRRQSVEVTGPVLAKRMEQDQLLLTVDTRRGALLATFRQRVSEIGLLVDAGDTITLGLREYRPLVNDPVLEAVKKGPGGGPVGRRPVTGRAPEEAEPSPSAPGRSMPNGLPATGSDSGAAAPTTAAPDTSPGAVSPPR